MPPPRRNPLMRPAPRTVPKKPVKLCKNGHRQSVLWTPKAGCSACNVDIARMAREYQARLAREAAERAPPSGPAPKSLAIRVVSEGRTLHFTIPPRLMKCNQRRRRPSRRRKV